MSTSPPVEFSIAPPPHDPYEDRRPPYSEDAEQAVIAAMLMDGNAIMRAAEHVDDTMFYREGHRLIFRAMLAIAERGDAVDPLTLSDELGRRGELEESGGKDYLAFLLDAVPTSANVEYHAKIVREKALQRRLIEVSTSIVIEAFEGRTTAAVLAASLRENIEPIAHGGAAGRPHRVWSLAELQENPQLLAAPTPALPRFAWRQRVTLLAAREKSGKSTTLAHAVAALTKGAPFLGEAAAEPGTCLWAYFEGHQGDVVRNLTAAHADPRRVHIAQGEPGRPDRLRDLIKQYAPAVVIIDALSSYTVGLVTDSWRAEQLTPVMNAISAMAQELDTAIVLVHHTTKSGTGYADSRAIGAGADMLLEMEGTAGEATPRKIKGVGRWPFSGFSFRMDGDELALVDEGEVPIDIHVLEFVNANPGCGSAKLRKSVGKRAGEADAAVRRLLVRGHIRDEVEGKNHHYFAIGEHLSGVDSEKGSGQGVGTGPLSHCNALSDNGVSQVRTTPLVPVPDTSIGTGDRWAGTGTGKYSCRGGCGQTFSAPNLLCLKCRNRATGGGGGVQAAAAERVGLMAGS